MALGSKNKDMFEAALTAMEEGLTRDEVCPQFDESTLFLTCAKGDALALFDCRLRFRRTT